jgi:hypothetical protein
MTKHFDENDAIGMLTKLQYLEVEELREGGKSRDGTCSFKVLRE